MPDETTQNTDVDPAGGEITPRIYASVRTPLNAAVAANVLLDNSTGYANAEQAADLDHGT